MNDPIIAKFHDIDAEIRLACHWMAITCQSGCLLNSMLKFVAHLTDHYFRELFKQEHVLDKTQLDFLLDSTDTAQTEKEESPHDYSQLFKLFSCLLSHVSASAPITFHITLDDCLERIHHAQFVQAV